MHKILAVLFMSASLFAQYPVNGGLGGGGGYTAPSGFETTVTGVTTLTVTAVQHGQGTKPWSKCFDNSVPAVEVACNDSVSTIGTVVFTWAPAFTGVVQIRGPGASAGAAGDFVGPSSSTSGNLVSFSGTSGKIGADSGIAATTVVKGAAALTTAGAVPYVVSAGVLGQAPTGLFYDAANVRLGVGTGSPGYAGTFKDVSDRQLFLDTASGQRYTSAYFANNGTRKAQMFYDNTLNFFAFGGSVAGASLQMVYGNGTGGAYLDGATGNFLISSGTTQAGYAFDIQRSGTTGTMRVFDQTAVTGVTSVLFSLGAAQTAASTIFTIAGVQRFNGTNSTGAGAALLGANSPASTLTAPYTWITVVTSDGSTGFIPVWK